MTEIIICRANEVLKRVEAQALAGEPVAAVLSIEHPGAALDKNGSAPRLPAHGHKDIAQKILVFWDSEQVVKDGPDLAQVKEGLEFILEHAHTGPVIIHCHAGKARSTAMALGAFAVLHSEKPENELIDMLLAIRPQAAPNILVVEMVDQLAGRGGRLLQAVLDHPVLSAQRAQAESNRRDMMRERPEWFARMSPEKAVPPETPPKP
ncbi:MAG TPA: hypothetical protein VEF76_00075 [Patescibacteria group bacterium]|nr:hypothetical protein [Patescibacteria group bacterium]